VGALCRVELAADAITLWPESLRVSQAPM